MEKSGKQKALKVLSIIWIVFAAIAIVGGIAATALGGVSLYGAGVSEVSSADAATMATGGTMAAAVGIVVIIIGVFDLIVAIFGLRGANDPSKIGVFFVLCIIGLVISLFNVISAVAQGSDASAIGSQLCSCIWPAICLWLAYSIKKQA